MMNEEIKITSMGENALLINFNQVINPDTLKNVLRISRIIEQKKLKGVNEVVPAYASLAVYFDPLVTSFNKLKNNLQKATKKAESKKYKGKNFLWEIPVCYERGVDINEYADSKDFSIDEIVQMHSSNEYLVYMRGFVPGFLYLGGLDAKLHLQRKSTPARKVPAGSVAIGGSQTGIYSLPAPAGWHVIGQTPVNLFNPEHHDIMPIKPGDRVKFKPINSTEFEVLQIVGDELLTEKKVLHD